MKKIIFSLTIFLLLFACKKEEGGKQAVEINNNKRTENSVYYWKTTFSLNDNERKFLSDNNIKRLYIRYFDVECRGDSWYAATPVGTIRFQDSIPSDLEIVPTVFIDNELFKSYDQVSEYVEKTLKRILVMSETNDIPNVREIQIDCDWTKTSEEKYFDFLKKMRAELIKRNIKLSATIRLHQLTMMPPPVDRGVLMCYNTGAVLDWDTENSILDAMHVKPYAVALSNYELPLDIAYPTFSWAVWFRYKRFKSLLRGISPNNENLEYVEKNIYKVKEGFYQEGHYLSSDDIIRFESSPMEEILKAKELLEHQLNDDYSVIIYHLDSANLSKYASHEIDKIYNN